MKKIYFSLLLITCAVFNNCKAQTVTIPDTVFVTWLHNNGYAGCMSGNQLDTTCNAVLNATTMNCYAIPVKDLTGVQYFKNLTFLDCSNDSLYNIPSLPNRLQQLKCQLNNLSALPALPDSLVLLDCNSNQLTALPGLPAGLITLNCFSNQLTSLPNLPVTLQYLACDENAAITSLPALPAALTTLGCTYCHISTLPALPPTLSNLYCNHNQLSGLPTLPSTLFILDCSYNPLHNLPALPAALHTLQCSANQLSNIPALPLTLAYLECSNDSLTGLPVLPLSLRLLNCGNNQISSLPALPPLLTVLDCPFNQLTALPELPEHLTDFDCSENPNLACLPQLKTIGHFDFSGTAVTCLPNYGSVTSSSPPLSSVPLCGIFNPNGCPSFSNISGRCYYDQNSDCSFNHIDVGTNYVKTQLYNADTLQQQVYTGGEGFYSFNAVSYGNYTLKVDTDNLPFIVSCPGTDSLSIILSAADSLSYSNNFAFKCRTQGFDVGVKSIINSGAVPRPAAMVGLNTTCGDMSQLYGAHCASGISGQVQITYTGNISYMGTAYGALAPTNIYNDTIIWDIADFGTVNDFTAFNLIFQIDSSATPGTQACFTVNVTATGADYDSSNNTASYCFAVVNAIDPNEKEAYPSGNIDTANHWLTYTIHFQNTGNAPALNIRVTDTLDNHLDPSTFQLLAYSAKNTTQIFGNDVVFNFPNINLPDSATSDSASRGYVQYKIKLKDNLPLGTQIQNTANIYFDLNTAVVTNTTLNTITAPTGIAQINQALSMHLYPNPAKDYVIVETDASAIGSTLNITDVTGRQVAKLQIANLKSKITTTGLAGGVYFVTLYNTTLGNATQKLVIQ